MVSQAPQNGSANVDIGPLLNVSASVMVGLAIDNDAITIIKYGSVSAARSDTTSALSVGPGVYRIVLDSTDLNTMGQMTVVVSASGAILWDSKVDVINSNTHALFYGSADSIAGSATVAGVSAAVAGVSAAVAGVSAAVAGVSAAISAHVAQALADYDVPTSADVSVLVSVGVNQALSNYGVPTSAAMSAMVSAVGSAVAAQALSDYGALVSANTSAAIEAAVFQRTMDEPTGAAAWGAPMKYDIAVEWVTQRALGRHHQASASVGLFNSADTQIASASVNITSTSANQDQWLS